MVSKTIALLSLLVILWSCGPRKDIQPLALDAPFSLGEKTEAKIIFIGDTGIDNQAMADFRKTLLKEEKDLIVILGDLVYPNGPRCPDGSASGIPERILDSVLGKTFIGLGAPVLLTLGNHDIGNRMGRNTASEACFLDYAAKHEDLVMPALNFELDLGVALIALTNTNAPADIPMKRIREAYTKHKGWKIFAGHHVLRTYHDKIREKFMMSLLEKHNLKPDLFVNGHAHFLQFGTYNAIPAATIGAAAKLRKRPQCPPDCGTGQEWGVSQQGYGVLSLTQNSMTMEFKDRFGKSLWQWKKTRESKPTEE